MKSEISLIVPVYNEEKIIEKNTSFIHSYLKKRKYKFEILLCNNGSSDKTFNIAQKLEKRFKEVRAFSSKKKGIGVGVKLGFKNAQYENLLFFAIDLGAEMRIIDDSLKWAEKSDVVIGSKGINEAVHEIPFHRQVFSKMYNVMIRFLFDLRVKDTQGYILFKKSKSHSFSRLLSSNNSFIQAQIIIYSNLFHLKMVEIPMFAGPERPDSRINPFREASVMLNDISKEYFRFRKVKRKLRRHRFSRRF